MLVCGAKDNLTEFNFAVPAAVDLLKPANFLTFFAAFPVGSSLVKNIAIIHVFLHFIHFCYKVDLLYY